MRSLLGTWHTDKAESLQESIKSPKNHACDEHTQEEKQLHRAWGGQPQPWCCLHVTAMKQCICENTNVLRITV